MTPARFRDLECCKINNKSKLKLHSSAQAQASTAEAAAPQITTLARVTIRGGSVAELSEWVKLRVSRMNALLTIYHDVGSLRRSHISFIYPQASVLLQCFGLRWAAKWSAATANMSSNAYIRVFRTKCGGLENIGDICICSTRWAFPQRPTTALKVQLTWSDHPPLWKTPHVTIVEILNIFLLTH